jgi:iron complex transport system substrate-binding protein
VLARSVSLSLSLLVLLALFVASCGSPPAPPANPTAAAAAATSTMPAFPLTITDDSGQQVVIAKMPERIVSISPSNTEILFALGLGPKVVAVDQFSDFPAEAKEKTQLGSYISPDIEQIVAATPDLVLGTEVHAREIAPTLRGHNLTVVVIDPKNLDQVLDRIILIGRITGQTESATALARDLQQRVTKVGDAVNGAPTPRVFVEISPQFHSPGANTFVDDLIRRAGGENIAADAPTQWPQLSQEVIVEKNPDVIILSHDAEGTNPESVKGRPGWGQISAVTQGRIVAIDPDLMNRPGPRLVDGLEAIARLLHPDRMR